MAKKAKRKSYKRTALDVTSPYSEPVKIGGKSRGRLALPETTAQARETGVKVAKREVESGSAKLKLSQLSRKQRKEAKNAQSSLEGYAEKYGTKEQKEFFEKANPAKLRHMMETGAIQAEEVFNYDDVTDKQGFRLSDTPKAENAIQRVIDTYNSLYG